jgi:hypothetical protein
MTAILYGNLRAEQAAHGLMLETPETWPYGN